jgi:hypothetical protein
MKGEKKLTLSGKPNTNPEKIISYLNQLPFDSKAVANQTLEARFLPFAIAKDDPNFQAVALQCAYICEAWAKAIREYAQSDYSERTITSTTPSSTATIVKKIAQSIDREHEEDNNHLDRLDEEEEDKEYYQKIDDELQQMGL